MLAAVHHMCPSQVRLQVEKKDTEKKKKKTMNKVGTIISLAKLDNGVVYNKVVDLRQEGCVGHPGVACQGNATSE